MHNILEGLSLDPTDILPLRHPNPALPASQRLYEILRDRIVSLDLAPDATLSRVELAEMYEVSQTPVREAMQRLEQDGLVRIFPQSRTVVSRIDVAQLKEAHFLRVSVESEISRRLAKAGEPARIAKAKTIVRMQEALGDNIEEADLFNALDDAFHESLYAAVGQSSLHRLIKSRSGHMARARRLELPREGKMASITEAHKAILDTIESGDEMAAIGAVQSHLSGTISRIGALIEANPDYFREDGT